jgi:hypothetical protein
MNLKSSLIASGVFGGILLTAFPVGGTVPSA